jgi:superfamily I DNA/RNA helicase
VIGDPNQSIYGYERVKEVGEMSPQLYYQKFKDIYKPKELYLSVNYRSYPQILKKADELLSLNKTKFDNMPPLDAFHQYDGNKPICEFYDLEKDKTDWKVKLKEILEYKSEKGEPYKDLAIMFRSNIEIYRAFNEIRKLNLPDVRIRVQGATGSLNKTREFHYFFKYY